MSGSPFQADFWSPTSDLCPPTSDLRRPTSDIRRLSSAPRPPTSDIRLLSLCPSLLVQLLQDKVLSSQDMLLHHLFHAVGLAVFDALQDLSVVLVAQGGPVF